MMKICIFLLLTFVFCAQVVKVTSVACDDDTDCVATDYTKDTCDATAKQCQCEAGYAATEEGCARKKRKPTLKTTNGEAPQSLAKTKISLTCEGTSGAEFEYYEGNTLLETSKDSYEPTLEDADKTYQCKEKGSSEEFDSDLSEELTIAIISDSNVVADGATPEIQQQLLPAAVATGKTFTPVCNNLPFGTTAVITSDDPDVDVTDGVITQHGDSNKSPKIQCKYTVGTSDKDAVEVPFPKLFEDLEDVELTITSEQVASGMTAFPTKSEIFLNCNINPGEEYTGPLTDPKYSWKQDGTVINDEDEAQYKLNTDSKNIFTKITCEVTDGQKTVVSAEFIDITIDDEYLEKPVALVDPKFPDILGNAQVKCVAADAVTELDLSVAVSWTKDGVNLEGQNDRTLQLTNLEVGKVGDFVCSTTKDGFKADSAPVTLEVPAGKKCANDGDCDEDEASLSGECADNRCVCADNYIAKDDQCGELQGIECDDNKDCEDDDSLSGTCNTETNLCECAENYSLDGDECKKDTVGLGCETNDDCNDNDASLDGTCDKETKMCNCAKNYSVKDGKCVETAGVSGLVASVVAVILAAVIPQIF